MPNFGPTCLHFPTAVLARGVVAWTVVAAVAVAGTVSLKPAAAIAQTPKGATTKAAKEAPAAGDDLATEATRRYKEGEFELAAQLFMKAYAADKRADRLFNAARAYEKAGKPSEAIPLFRLYITLTDSPAGREEARLRIDALEAAARQGQIRPTPGEPVPQPQAPRPPEAPPAVPPPEAPVAPPQSQTLPRQAPPPSRVVPYLLLGGGAVVALTGLAVALDAGSDEDALWDDLAKTDGNGTVIGVTDRDTRERSDAIARNRTIGAVLGGVGLATAAVGGYLGWVRSPSVAAWQVLPAANGVAIAGRF